MRRAQAGEGVQTLADSSYSTATVRGAGSPCAPVGPGQDGDHVHALPGALHRPHAPPPPLPCLWLCECFRGRPGLCLPPHPPGPPPAPPRPPPRPTIHLGLHLPHPGLPPIHLGLYLPHNPALPVSFLTSTTASQEPVWSQQAPHNTLPFHRRQNESGRGQTTCPVVICLLLFSLSPRLQSRS